MRRHLPLFWIRNNLGGAKMSLTACKSPARLMGSKGGMVRLLH